jgi:hypothetical protein
MDWEKPCSARLAEWREEREALRHSALTDADAAALKIAEKRLRLLSFLLKRYEHPVGDARREPH